VRNPLNPLETDAWRAGLSFWKQQQLAASSSGPNGAQIKWQSTSDQDFGPCCRPVTYKGGRRFTRGRIFTWLAAKVGNFWGVPFMKVAWPICVIHLVLGWSARAWLLVTFGHCNGIPAQRTLAITAVGKHSL
jgi:hypothetical protein